MRRTLPVLLLALLAALPAAAAVGSADAEVAFTYGVRAFNRGALDEAVRLFREAVAADPGDGTARYWLGLALLRQGAAAEAARELEAALAAERPAAVDRARAEEDLRRARTGAGGGGEAVAAPGLAGLLPLRDRPRFDLRAGVLYGQDSNPLLIPEGGGAAIPREGLFFAGEQEDEVANLDLRAAAYPLYGRGGWSLGLVAEAGTARFADLDFLDETRWRGALQLAWGSDPLGYLAGPLGYTRVPFGHSRAALLFQVGTSDTRLDGDPLIRIDEAALTLALRETVATATQLELDLEQRELLDGAADSDLLAASLSQLFFLGRRDRWLRVGGLWSEEDGALGGDVSSLGATAELALPLAERWTLQLAATRRTDDFEPPAGAAFEDTTLRAAGALSWALTRHLYLIGRASWTERDSDLLRFGFFAERDYQRTTAGLGLQWLY